MHLYSNCKKNQNKKKKLFTPQFKRYFFFAPITILFFIQNLQRGFYFPKKTQIFIRLASWFSCNSLSLFFHPAEKQLYAFPLSITRSAVNKAHCFTVERYNIGIGAPVNIELEKEDQTTKCCVKKNGKN